MIDEDAKVTVRDSLLPMLEAFSSTFQRDIIYHDRVKGDFMTVLAREFDFIVS